jgi:4-amino-4-deoxy-L-arabinose transferase-like glycosyltransferase
MAVAVADKRGMDIEHRTVAHAPAPFTPAGGPATVRAMTDDASVEAAAPAGPADAAAATTPALRGGLSTYELIVVAVLCLAFLVPGIWGYSLVDPWETHYGEVGRRMLQDGDWAHTDWQHEGFRSKPVLTFWMVAAGLKAFGQASGGGYSGEMVSSPMIMFAMRLPFVLAAIGGLLSVWWMLGRLVSRRVAYLALLAIATCPVYCLVARQAITDMPLAACVMGAMAMFALATQDGDRPITPFARPFGIALDMRHVMFAVLGGFVAIQAVYYAGYLYANGVADRLAVKGFFQPHLIVPGAMLFCLLYQHSKAWRAIVCALPMVVVAAEKPAPGDEGKSLLARAEAYAPDYWLLRVLIAPVMMILHGAGAGWTAAGPVARHLVTPRPIARTGQVYMLWFWGFVAISILAKGPPGLAVVGLTCALYVVVANQWRALYDGAFELQRGLVLGVAVAIPWHVVMWLKEGRAFIKEYLGAHVFGRATVAELGSKGTFDYYLPQIGYGMFVWAALVPIAVAAAVMAGTPRSPRDRVRMIAALWAICGTAFFMVIQTKFHHYILPVVPAFAILVAFWLDDFLAGRSRGGAVVALVGAAIILLITRDFLFEEQSWIEMFVFRYDRPWPSAEPWAVNATDGFLGLGLAGAGAMLLFGFHRLRVLAVSALALVGLATGLWAMHVYMPVAATHWGMREAARRYYDEREIYGARLVYYGADQLADAWDGRTSWTIDTLVPDHIWIGQPMTIKVSLRNPADTTTLGDVAVRGVVTDVGDHSLEIGLDPAGVKSVAQLAAHHPDHAAPVRRAISVVDADRLISWQLYWRGEVFWSGDEIWGPLPDLRTDWQLETNNAGLLKYLGDATSAPPGRRYFVLTEAGRIQTLRSTVPTPRAKETFEVLDTTSNKFTLAAFWL